MNIEFWIITTILILIVFFIIKYLITNIQFNDIISEDYFYNKYSDGFDVNFDYIPDKIESFQNLNIKKKYPPMKLNKYIWIYWENIDGAKCPTFVKLCIDSIKKHLGKYNLIILNEKNIKKYLPELRKDFDNLMIAQKVDYYRVALLYKYGGIWLDADTIVLKDIKPIFKKLEEGYDYVGFGCTGMKCRNGYFRPSNGIMASRPKGILMKACLDKLNKKLDERNKITDKGSDATYFDYGKIIIWKCLDDLKQNGYDYYHFTSEYDGTRDINTNWMHTPNFFRTTPSKFLDPKKLMFVVLYNSEVNKNENYHWAKTCSPQRLLKGKEFICSLFRKALKN